MAERIPLVFGYDSGSPVSFDEMTSGDTIPAASLPAVYVPKNEAITPGTGTKITYDANGLVTKGENATQDDIGDGVTYKRFSATEQSKLSGIAEGAEVNVNADWSASSGDAQILNKPTSISGYGITDAYTKTEIDNKIASVYKYKGSVATYAGLPTEDLVIGDVYNVTNSGVNYAWTGTEWDDIGAAEALVSRLWCSFHMTEEDWMLELPQALHEPILLAMNTPEYPQVKELLLRYDAMMMGLLYIAGFLHCAQPIQTFTRDVVGNSDRLSEDLARRYLKSAFEYMTDSSNQMILLHPGLADPYRLIAAVNSEELFTLELSQEMMAGGMNGLFPEEEPLHEAMCGALEGFLRPEYDVAEATEDLRMLAKQGVSLRAMEAVMASMLCVMPTPAMKRALEQLHQCTPHWIGLRADLQH